MGDHQKREKGNREVKRKRISAEDPSWWCSETSIKGEKNEKTNTGTDVHPRTKEPRKVCEKGK